MRTLRTAIFDARCIGCGAGDGAVCVDCAPALSERAVREYPRLSDSAIDPLAEAIEPKQAAPSTLPVGYIGEYAGAWRDAVLAFKDGRRDVGDAFVRYLALRAGAVTPTAAIEAVARGRLVLAGIPTSDARRSERGFDGGEFLADGLGAAWGVPSVRLLRLTRRDHQRGKTRLERLDARRRFVLRDGHHRRLHDVGSISVLLVDDVLTTGSTLRDACATIEAAGIAVAGALTLAYVPSSG